jgi:hypothetical protein
VRQSSQRGRRQLAARAVEAGVEGNEAARQVPLRGQDSKGTPTLRRLRAAAALQAASVEPVPEVAGLRQFRRNRQPTYPHIAAL